LQLPLGDVIEEFALDAERPPCECDLDLALFTNIVDVLLKQAGDVTGIKGRSDRHDRARSGDPARCREHGGATQAVTDQDRGR
jgi:hypothetical protein